MKKKITSLSILALALLVLSGCSTPAVSSNSSAEKPAEVSGKLVVYSPSTEDIISAIIPEFEKSTGISVEIITAGSGELWKRIEAEKDRPICDVMWGGTQSATVNNIELLEEFTSKYNDEIPKDYQNTSNKITYYCLDGSALLVNNNLIGDIVINGYADLLNPELKGEISMGDPANSSAAYAQLTNMLLAVGGDYESDKGWDFVQALIANAEGKMGSSSSVVHKSVVDGEYIVGITFEAATIGYERDEAPIKAVYMQEGVAFLPGPAGIIKNAPNKENAEKFIDFILSPEAQQILADLMIARPIRSDIDLPAPWTPIGEMKVLIEDTAYTQAHKVEILDRYKDILTSVS